MQSFNHPKQHTKSPRVSSLSFSWYDVIMPWALWMSKIPSHTCLSFNLQLFNRIVCVIKSDEDFACCLEYELAPRLEVDRISVSAPKLVKSLVSAWFRFRNVKPRQVSAETVSEFRCWPKLGSCCLHQFFRVRAELYVIAVPPQSARIYPMQCDGTAGRAWRAPHSSSHLQLHCCSICSLLVSTRVVSPGGLSLSFAAYNSVHDHLQLSSDSETTGNLPAYQQELENYLRETRLPRSTDIYAYWHNSQYRSLEPAAKKYLSAPPTSVASEQLFSSAGQLYADRCNSLNGDNAEKLLFLSYNIRLFSFNYWLYLTVTELCGV